MSDGFHWYEDILLQWLEQEPTIRFCAIDVLNLHAGDREHIWLSKFLFDILYGAGFPGANNIRIKKIADYGSLNFSSVDFKRIASVLKGE